MPSMRRCSSSTSTSFAISRRSRASAVCPVSWRFTRRFRLKPLRNSSPTPRPIPARSIWRRPEPDRGPTWPVKCLRQWPASTCFMCLIEVHKCFPLAGDVHVYFGPLLSSIEYVRTGKLRALAVTTTTRSDVLPDVPVLSDTLPDYEASAWFGIGAPKSTPAELIERLNKEVNISTADPKLKARLANLGGTALAGSPADFGKLISDETKKWGKVIVAANIKPR